MLSVVVCVLALLVVAGPVFGDVVVEMPDAWTPREESWRFDDDTATNTDPHAHSGVLALTDKVFTDVRVSVETRINHEYRDADRTWSGIILRAQRPLVDGAWNGGYHLFMRANGEVVLRRAGDDSRKTAMTAVRPDEQFVNLTLAAAGTSIRGYVNGELLVETEDTVYTKGEIALVHFANESVFRAVQVQGNVVAAPAVAVVDPEHPTPEAHAPVTPLPGIGVRTDTDGAPMFYCRDTGERFVPKGFNHTVLSDVSEGWHATFNVGHYNSEDMAALLKEMAGHGANTIRVWAWGIQNASGFTGGRESRGLNGAYMENFVDFLRLCTKHDLYVVPILDETPRNAYYDSVAAYADAELPTPAVTGYNATYMSAGVLAAKKQATRDFIQFVKEADAGLLNTVLGWAFANEAFVNHHQGPFDREAGAVTTFTGRSYDMADNAQRQACYDETILQWCNVLTEAVKSIAPEALTTIGMWTSDAHGRPAVNYLLPDDRDPRRPPRPSVLAGSNSALDFLDIHIYPWDGTSKVRRDAHEWDALKKSDKPVIVGEYGVFKNRSIDEARVMLREMLEQAFDMGYQGALHWVWDLTAVPGQTWSAVEEDLAAYLMTLDVYPSPDTTDTAP